MVPGGDALPSLLLVEDSETDAAIIARSLETAHVGRTQVVATGGEALDRCAQGQFDAVLLDHRLPDMTGLDVLRRLREQSSETPVIVITGAGNEHVAVEAMKLGASDYLVKDEIMTSALPRAVASALERRQAQREREVREAEEQRRQELEGALEDQRRLIERLESQIAGASGLGLQSAQMSQEEWEKLSASYQRLTQAFLAHPQLPPVRELDDFAAAAARAMLSPHQIMALHYAALNQLLASGEGATPERTSEARLALVSVLLRVMDEYRQTLAEARTPNEGAL